MLQHQAGRLADAEALYRQILAAQPHHAEALHHLGIVAHQVGRSDLATEWIRQAIVLNAGNPAAHSNLGEACRATGRLGEAIAAYHRAIALKPDYPEAHNNLGNALREQGQLDEAVASCQRAIALSPGHPVPYNSLGIALAGLGRLDEALAAFHRALELKPDYAEAHNNLSNALRQRGRLDESVAAARRALDFNANYPEACNSLGNALRDLGRLDETIAAYREALRLRPDAPGVHSNLIYALHFQPRQDDQVITLEHRHWNRRFGDPLKPSILPHAHDRSPERRLRVGYVSPDFRDHVVGRNLVPLLECHDPLQFEILCYSGVVTPDGFTDIFRRRAGQWRSTVGMTDAALAETIRRDGVDILVDLTQHMAGNRLPLFARQPAPVQVSFAGYPGSTGLEAIEHRISDRYLEGACADQETGLEEQVHLIESFWCYDPCGSETQVNGLPAQQRGRVTFGSLNNFCKNGDLVLKLWAQVLRRVKESRLVLLCGAGSHRQRTLQFLEREGVEAHRVEFVSWRSRRAYLELYHRLDIVLDPFPYNGHTTSLDALWMGVPVVSLAGAMPVSRAGLSILTNVGLTELVAHTEDQYVSRAVELAGDLPRLVELRATLRPRMEASPLMDAPGFARNIESAYRTMWRRWCAK